MRLDPGLPLWRSSAVAGPVLKATQACAPQAREEAFVIFFVSQAASQQSPGQDSLAISDATPRLAVSAPSLARLPGCSSSAAKLVPFRSKAGKRELDAAIEKYAKFVSSAASSVEARRQQRKAGREEKIAAAFVLDMSSMQLLGCAIYWADAGRLSGQVPVALEQIRQQPLAPTQVQIEGAMARLSVLPTASYQGAALLVLSLLGGPEGEEAATTWYGVVRGADDLGRVARRYCRAMGLCDDQAGTAAACAARKLELPEPEDDGKLQLLVVELAQESLIPVVRSFPGFYCGMLDPGTQELVRAAIHPVLLANLGGVKDKQLNLLDRCTYLCCQRDWQIEAYKEDMATLAAALAGEGPEASEESQPSRPPELVHEEAGGGDRAASGRCGRCQLARFCDAHCQALAWGSHRGVCGRIVAARRRVEAGGGA